MFEQGSSHRPSVIGFDIFSLAKEETFGVWPCNWESVTFFISVMTQWRVGMAGPTGLDYAAVLALLREQGWPRQKRQAIFYDVQVMESEALAVMAENRDND